MKTNKMSLGTLFIRTKDHKRFPAGSKNVKGGCYYLQYQAPTGQINHHGNEIKTTKRVKLFDEDNNEIITLREAKKAQEKFIRLNVLASKEERLVQLKNELEKTQNQKLEVLKEQNPPLMIKDAWEVFISHPSLDIGETLEYNYRGHWKRFINWRDNDNSYLKDITKEMALDYARFLGKKLSASTYNKHINFLKLLFSTLKDEAQLTELVFESITSKKLKTNSKKPLSFEQMLMLIDNAEGDLKILLMIGATTGLRFGDCVTLRWSEINLNEGLISRVPNKTSKSKGTPSLIGIPADLILHLSTVKKAKRSGYVFEEWANDYNYVSSSGSNTRRGKIQKMITRHFEANGIQCTRVGKTRSITDYGFHSLRHAYVVQQASRGVNPLFIEKQVGHSNPQMTLHYTSIDEKTAKQNTLSLNDGVKDADYEIVDEVNIQQALKSMNSKNWKKVRDEILEKIVYAR